MRDALNGANISALPPPSPACLPACLSASPPACSQAISSAVDHDLQLIADRVRRLTGPQGAARLEAALAAARAAVATAYAAQEREAAAAAAAEPEPQSPAAMSRWAILTVSMVKGAQSFSIMNYHKGDRHSAVQPVLPESI
jgi:hypothetical protein